MRLSTELMPCACWTAWRWLPGRRGWRLQELFSTWPRVSSHHLKFYGWSVRTFWFSVLHLTSARFLSAQERLQSAALKLRCSTGWDTTSFCCWTWGPSQLWWNFSTWRLSMLSVIHFLAMQKTTYITYACFLLPQVSNLTSWAIFALVPTKRNIFVPPSSNSAACSSAVRKPAISLADSTDLRVLLNIMYLMVETIQQDDPADKPEWKIIRETFRAELGEYQQRS